MTTKIRLLAAPDLFIDNQVYCLRREAEEPSISLAGMAWIIEREPVAIAHRKALEHATSLVLSNLTGYALWLLAGHTCWQDNSRITRHRKLWGSLKAGGLEIPSGREMKESCIEAKDGLRYFGALQLTQGALDAAAAILKAEPISHLAALPSEHSGVIGELVKRGWDHPAAGPSMQLVKAVCGSSGVVFWTVGAFDDVEAGAIALGVPAVLNKLLESARECSQQ